MPNDAKKQAMQPWLPAVFCAVLAVLALLGEIASAFITGASPGAGLISLMAFLPMCFYFTGVSIAGMQRDVSELKQQVADLQSKQPAAS